MNEKSDHQKNNEIEVKIDKEANNYSFHDNKIS